MLQRILPVFAVIVLGVAAAFGAEVMETLAAKGATFKKDKAGAATEISFAQNSKLTPEDWKLAGSLTSLMRANMSMSETSLLNDETAQAIAGLTKLERFFSNGAEVTNDGMKAFAGWKSLKHFGFDHWGWKVAGKSQPLGAGIAHLAAIPGLESVRFGGCRIDNTACDGLAKLSTLQSIDLFHCYAVTDEGIEKLTGLPKLRIITLAPQFTPRITDKTLESLSKIATMEEIHLGETWLTYENGFSHLKKLPKLRLLELKQVVAEEKDIARLKADCPDLKVDWTPADETNAAQTRQRFQRAKEKR